MAGRHPSSFPSRLLIVAASLSSAEAEELKLAGVVEDETGCMGLIGVLV